MSSNSVLQPNHAYSQNALSGNLIVIPKAEESVSEMPLVSVVMAVCNPIERFFCQAVRSILEQRLVDLELIIVEDPSLSSAVGMLPKRPRFEIRCFVNAERTSLVKQRNLSLELCRGSYIAIMDADDVSHPYRIIKQLNFLMHNRDIDVVGTSVSVIDGHSRIVGYREYPTHHDAIFDAMCQSVPLCHPSCMMRRCIVETYGGYCSDVVIAEDFEYWCRLIQSGTRFANIQEPLLFYRVHGSQLKQQRVRETIASVRDLRSRYWGGTCRSKVRIRNWIESILLRIPSVIASWLVRRVLWNYRPSRAASKVRFGTQQCFEPLSR